MSYLEAKDTISGKMGRAVATIDGNVEEMFYLTELEATMEKMKKEIPILGKTSNETKSTGAKYSGTMKIYYVTSRFRELMLKYAKTGEDTYFSVLVENEDPTSATGKQSILLKNVNLDKINVAKLIITSDDSLSEEMSFTFSDWDILNSFTPLQ